MIVLNEKIRKAIAKAIDEIGGQSELSRKTGISQQNFSKYISGYVNKIGDRTWDALFPFIKKYLPSDFPVNIPQRPMLKSDFSPDAEAIPADPGRLRAVPVLSFAQAAGFEPAVEPLCDYIRENSERTQPFMDVPETWFALEVHGDSMEPDYPDGSIALVAAGEFPVRGDIVVAKLSTGQVVMKEYHRKDGVITLKSRNPQGQNFEWNIKEQPGFIQWMFPVMQIMIDTRAQRHSRTDHEFE